MLTEQLSFVNDIPQGVREAIVRVLLAILALALIWVLRHVFTWILIKPLQFVTRRTGMEKDDLAVDAIVGPMRYIVIAIGLIVAAEILDVSEGINQFIDNLGRSLVIIGLLMMIYRMVDVFTPTSTRLFRLTGITIEEQLLPFLRTGVKLIVIAIAVVVVLQEWGYDVTGLIAGLGLAGLAFSLAAQDTVSNLFGFAAILSDRPLNVNEYVITPDAQGVVEHVGLRSTRIRTLDQSVIYVPNRKLADSAITNWSRLEKRRVNYLLGVTYDSTSGDIRVLVHRIREMLKAQETINEDSVWVYFMEFGASSLDILIRAYVNIADWGEFQAEKERLHLEVMDIVADLDMSVAFPSRSIYVENVAEFLDVETPPKKRPTLSPRERALMRGESREETSQDGGGTDEENPTRQQDEPDED